MMRDIVWKAITLAAFTVGMALMPFAGAKEPSVGLSRRQMYARARIMNTVRQGFAEAAIRETVRSNVAESALAKAERNRRKSVLSGYRLHG